MTSTGHAAEPTGNEHIPSPAVDKSKQFAYFDQQLGRPQWAGASVLDFGGGRGDLLAGAAGAIEPRRYWNLEISRHAVPRGARRFPGAHFVHYDRWHHRYNPLGKPREPVPTLPVKFDFILAFSVFTMIDADELVELAGALRSQLAPGGVLAFTFIDPAYRQPREGRLLTNLEWRLDVAAADGIPIEPHTFAAAGQQTESCYLIEQRWIEPEPRLAFETFLTVDHVKALLPDCQTLPPTAAVRHHCCVIRAPHAR